MALAVTGCAKKNTETTTASGGDKGGLCATGGKGPKIGLAYDIGGRGDKSFNDLAAAGTKKASEELDATCKESEAAPDEPDSAKEERLRTLADAGYDPIIAVGFVYTPMVTKVAKEYPKLKFAIVDGAAEGKNVTNLAFSPEQGSYLVGVAAALKTKTNNIGFVGGVDVPLINTFQAGFEAGVKATNPKAKVQVKYLTQPPDFSGFGDPAKGKTAAAGMFDAGADIVFQVAGGSGGGVFEAAKAAGGKAIGVDSDQYLTADPKVKDVIMTSMLKKVDVAVYDFITSVNDDKFTAGTTTYDLAKDGVGYATSGGQVDDIKTQLEAAKAKIISGEIKVPTK
jgi:basic membrane protein A